MVRGGCQGGGGSGSYRVCLYEVYMSLAKCLIFLFIPVGWSVWRRQIHFSSSSSRSSGEAMPDCRMQTSRSSKVCPEWKCSASSEFPGRFLMSDRCLPNLFAKDFPVWPTHRRSCFLHRAAYIRFSVLQVPPSASLIVISFLELVMVEFFRICLQ